MIFQHVFYFRAGVIPALPEEPAGGVNQPARPCWLAVRVGSMAATCLPRSSGQPLQAATFLWPRRLAFQHNSSFPPSQTLC